MKIRIQDNSVRLRLTQSEVNNFAEKGNVEAKTVFGDSPQSTLTYALVRADCNELKAEFKNNRIEISVPEKLATVWTSTELVGLDNNPATNGESGLKILVEKDFACLKAREGEDESDMFPHPEEETRNC